MIAVNYVLEVDTDFIVGCGMGSLYSDDTTQIDGHNRPIIPGTTIKGILRWEAASLCDFLEIKVCDGTLANSGRICGINREGPCPICVVFGSNVYPSPFHFSTATLQDEVAPELRRRAFNAISEETGTVEEKKLFFLEMGQGGRFSGEIRQFLPLPEALRESEATPRIIENLLLLSMGLVRAVGGGKNRGHGRCKFLLPRTPGESAVDEVRAWPF